MRCKPFAGFALIAAVATLAGCATSNRLLFEKRGIKVVLSTQRGADLGLNHPALISPVRLSHILSRIDLRSTGGTAHTRTPAIPLESLEPISDALSRGLNAAGPNDHVILYSTRRTKKHLIFDRDYLTSFIAYVEGENLILHLSRSDWEIPKKRKKRLPPPAIGKHPSPFRVMPSQSMEVIGQQSLAIAWKEALFFRPSRTRVDQTGKTVRKTILLESQDAIQPSKPRRERIPLPAGLTSNSLRALADLEDQRRRGEISEVVYQRRREEILAVDAPSP
jgi:hypothetical protein